MWNPGVDHRQAILLTWRRRVWLATAVMSLLVVDTALWRLGPPSFLTSAMRLLASGRTVTIASAASFSVSAGSFATRERAMSFAASLDAAGLPVLVRERPEDARFQVLVGPYVSTDEAEQAQRALAVWGLGDARLVVDDSMRGGAGTQRAAFFVSSTARQGVLIVAAPGMSSVVFEMPTPPREVETRRTSATTLDIEIGRAPETGPAAVLSMPEGVLLVRTLVVANAAGNEAAGTRARLVVPEGVQSRLRLEGTRVYVDLAWPSPPWQVGVPAPRLTRASHDAPDAQRESTARAAYREQFVAAAQRFEQIEPFLISAVASPDPDVLAALAHSLEAVGQSLAGTTPPAELAVPHQLLRASIALAVSTTTPSFAGDRAAVVRQAMAMLGEAVKAV